MHASSKISKLNNVISSTAFDTTSARYSFDMRDNIQFFLQNHFIQVTENPFEPENVCLRISRKSS